MLVSAFLSQFLRPSFRKQFCCHVHLSKLTLALHDVLCGVRKARIYLTTLRSQHAVLFSIECSDENKQWRRRDLEGGSSGLICLLEGLRKPWEVPGRALGVKVEIRTKRLPSMKSEGALLEPILSVRMTSQQRCVCDSCHRQARTDCQHFVTWRCTARTVKD